MQAVAVDKGTGSSNEGEGSAVVFSDAVHYHSKPFVKKPTQEEIVRKNIQLKYPSFLCK